MPALSRAKTLIFLFAVLAPWQVFAAPTYRIIDLGDLPGGIDQSFGHGLNDLGQVVGSSSAVLDKQEFETFDYHHAFVWSASTGTMQDLGTFPGDILSEAHAINNAGRIAGASGVPEATGFTFWNAATGSITDYAPYFGRELAKPRALNAAGDMVGYNNQYHSCCDFAVAPVALETPPGSIETGPFLSYAHDINNGRQIVGSYYSLFGDDPAAAVLWNAAGEARELGSLTPGADSVALGINDSGQVVGGSGLEAFLWNPAPAIMQPLGVLPGDTSSQALAINDAGLVLGVSASATGQRAFLWSAGEGIVDLASRITNATGWTSIIGADINRAGQIVGTGRNPDGVQHAFLLEPAPPVPEPETWASMVLGISLAGWAARARRRPARGRIVA
jgi:probable HAF family extracellular repeat protein